MPGWRREPSAEDVRTGSASSERAVEQSVDYPQLVLIDLFEFPAVPQRDRTAYPKTGEVASVRGYRHASDVSR
jgi:hypothetical protein